MSMCTLSELARAVGGELSGADREFATVATDTRALRQDELFVALRGPNFDGNEYVADAAARGAAGALVERIAECALGQVRVDDTRAALGRFAAAWRSRFSLPLIALTGSNGKTTTKEMLAAILRQRGRVMATAGNFNNDIGVPLTLLRLRDSHAAAVVEMGANHAGEIALLARLATPLVGLVTNASAAHLEGFGSLEGVARAKGELYAGLDPAGTAVINADDAFAPLWREMAGTRRCVTFGMTAPADISAHEVRTTTRDFEQAFTLRTPDGAVPVTLPLPGRHNIMNALAAASGAWAAGAGCAEIAGGLAATQTIAGRLRLLDAHGARLIDDCYNANPASLYAAVDVVTALTGDTWVVLGDMGELGADEIELHHAAGEHMREHGVMRLFTLGALAAQAAEGFGAGARAFGDVDALVDVVRNELHPGVNLLIKGSRRMRLERVVTALSPAGSGGTN